jgi:L-fuconolactonase
MDIVDAQIHLFITMDPTAALAVMDSLGIQAAVIDEFRGYDANDQPMPGYKTEQGIFRSTASGAASVSAQYPERFAWLLRIDPFDHGYERLMEEVKASPQGRAIRLGARGETPARHLAEGAFTDYFRTAERLGLPMFVLTLNNSHLLEPYAKAFPDLRIVIDHCGLPQTPADYDQVLALAKYRNVHVKWCHAPRVFGATSYPFAEARPYLARTLDAFGRERVMWASDFTASRGLYNWSEAFYYMRDNPGLSEGDKEWVLGRTARTVLDWPKPATPARPPLHRH